MSPAEVAAGVLAATQWLLEHSEEGVRLPDELPHRAALAAAKPYLGPYVSRSVDWTPLDSWPETVANFGRPAHLRSTFGSSTPSSCPPAAARSHCTPWGVNRAMSGRNGPAMRSSSRTPWMPKRSTPNFRLYPVVRTDPDARPGPRRRAEHGRPLMIGYEDEPKRSAVPDAAHARDLRVATGVPAGAWFDASSGRETARLGDSCSTRPAPRGGAARTCATPGSGGCGRPRRRPPLLLRPPAPTGRRREPPFRHCSVRRRGVARDSWTAASSRPLQHHGDHRQRPARGPTWRS